MFRLRTLAPVALATGLIVSLGVGAGASADDRADGRSAVAVANRGSGDVSFIDTSTLAVTTVDLPGEAEPMYVNHDPEHGVVLVGDRASSTVVALDDTTYEVVGSVPVGDGVFHQWLDTSRDQLWVVGTAASTVTVVDTDTLTPVTTFPIPDDLIAAGGVTHDVFVKGNHAFVSLVGLDGHGVVLRYSTRTFENTGRIVTGGDPHLFVQAGRLHVASQEDGTVTTYVPATLRLVDEADVPAAHGIFVTADNDVFATNISGGGDDALWRLDRQLDPVGEPIDTDAAIPHNVAVTGDGIAYVTHSGPNTVVSVVDPDTGSTTLVTVGTNPFGLGVVS